MNLKKEILGTLQREGQIISCFSGSNKWVGTNIQKGTDLYINRKNF